MFPERCNYTVVHTFIGSSVKPTNVRYVWALLILRWRLWLSRPLPGEWVWAGGRPRETPAFFTWLWYLWRGCRKVKEMVCGAFVRLSQLLYFVAVSSLHPCVRGPRRGEGSLSRAWAGAVWARGDEMGELGSTGFSVNLDRNLLFSWIAFSFSSLWEYFNKLLIINKVGSENDFSVWTHHSSQPDANFLFHQSVFIDLYIYYFLLRWKYT